MGEVQPELPERPHAPGPSAEVHEEENGHDAVLPEMLFEQESHDLFCPICEHAVTGEVVLQKRKRELKPDQSGGRRHGIQANFHRRSPLPSSKQSVTDAQIVVPDVLQEQTGYDLLCPECSSCITHEVVLEKRRRSTSTSDALPRSKPSSEGLGAHRHGKHSQPGTSGGERIGDSPDPDSPFKRHRRSGKPAESESESDPERETMESMIRIGQNGRPQIGRTYDLSCPDCSSCITSQVILNKKESAPGTAFGHLLDKRRRRRRKSTRDVDDNPWKTRYKLQHGHTKPTFVETQGKRVAVQEVLQPKEPEAPGEKHGAANGERSPGQPGQRDYPQYGAATANESSAQPDKREAPPSGAAEYGTTVMEKLLKEPLLPVQEEATGEAAVPRLTIRRRCWDIIGPAMTYFGVMIFLYCVLWVILAI